MVMMMYRVFILCTGKIALFQEQVDAQNYIKTMEGRGHKVSLNRFTWRVEIED